MTELESLREQLRDFTAARDWDQFHWPKNPAMALLVEAGELLKTFQWLTEEQSGRLAPEARAVASDEVADVLLYLIRQSDKSAIDPIATANRNLLANANRYSKL